jgi:hypothetical protein
MNAIVTRAKRRTNSAKNSEHMVHDALGPVWIVLLQVAVEFMNALNDALPTESFTLGALVPTMDRHGFIRNSNVMSDVG